MAKGEAARLYDKARLKALQDLRALHPGEYEVLLQGHLAELKQQVGYADGRRRGAREAERG